MSVPVATTLCASVVTNLVVTNVVVRVLGYKSDSLRAYYNELGMLAVGLDVTSLCWGCLLAQRISDGIGAQIVAAVAIQLAHDITFGAWLRRSRSQRRVRQLFRAYASEHGTGILKVDAAFMVVCVSLCHALRRLAAQDVALVGSASLYVHLLSLPS